MIVVIREFVFSPPTTDYLDINRDSNCDNRSVVVLIPFAIADRTKIAEVMKYSTAHVRLFVLSTTVIGLHSVGICADRVEVNDTLCDAQLGAAISGLISKELWALQRKFKGLTLSDAMTHFRLIYFSLRFLGKLAVRAILW